MLITILFTLNCLSIGTPKTIDFPFVQNGKLMVSDVPIFEQSTGTPKTINFPFVPNGKLMVLGVPIFEHIVIRL